MLQAFEEIKKRKEPYYGVMQGLLQLNFTNWDYNRKRADISDIGPHYLMYKKVNKNV